MSKKTNSCRLHNENMKESLKIRCRSFEKKLKYFISVFFFFLICIQYLFGGKLASQNTLNAEKQNLKNRFYPH